MSHLLAPLVAPMLGVAVKTFIDSAGTVIYYTGAGVWWLGKRAIYGYQPSEAEIREEKEREQERRRQEQEEERAKERKEILQMTEQVLEREREIAELLKQIKTNGA